VPVRHEPCERCAAKGYTDTHVRTTREGLGIVIHGWSVPPVTTQRRSELFVNVTKYGGHVSATISTPRGASESGTPMGPINVAPQWVFVSKYVMFPWKQQMYLGNYGRQGRDLADPPHRSMGIRIGLTNRQSPPRNLTAGRGGISLEGRLPPE
jgi:hypothetical protein